MTRRAEVVLSREDREVLERWARRPSNAQALALRCQIVLAAADGQSTREIAARLDAIRRRSPTGGVGLSVGRWMGSTMSCGRASRARSATIN